MAHPPYSPDLARRDLFFSNKKLLKKNQFSLSEDALSALEEAVKEVSELDFKKVL